MDKLEQKNYFYRLVHYYAKDNDVTSVFLKTTIDCPDLIYILSAIQFKFEELVDESLGMDERHIMDILKRFYGVEEVTGTLKPFLPELNMDKVKWDVANPIVLTDGEYVLTVTQVDLYASRESCCGPGYQELMSTYLPQTKEFEDEIKNLKDYYPLNPSY